MEQWKPVPGYEGTYEVSNRGRIRSMSRNIIVFGNRELHKDEVIMKPREETYLRVCLKKDGKYKVHPVHRLVALAFIPNPDNLPQINHKDENKYNNNVENLEWCTPSYNCKYGTVVKRRYDNGGGSRKIVVEQYDLNGNLLNTYPSICEASRQTDVNRNSIRLVLIGRLKTGKGFIWKRKETT